MLPAARFHAVALDARVGVADAVRRLAHRTRLTAWAGSWSGGAVLTCDPAEYAGTDDDPHAVLARLPRVTGAVPDGAVGGGWFGYLAFPATADAGVPRWSLAYHRDVLRHDGRRWWYEALLDDTFDEDAAAARCAGLASDLDTPVDLEPARLELGALPDAAVHAAAVERCVQAIRRGEVYQANIATMLPLRLHGSPADAWARLVERFAPARAGLVADPACTAVGASPELFLHRHGDHPHGDPGHGSVVRTEPIKGTRPRRGGPDDARERDLLAGSAKDAAENVMIVDLMRNDLSRVCATGTVTVPRLLAVEPHPGVWHLVSEVRGRLPAGTGDDALLAAAFPPGSVTGAPKIRAIELIEALEATPRGLFTGAMGYASPLAGLELAVTIRTLEVLPDGTARLGVGGGVTVDSTPSEEWRECLTKAAPVLAALGAAGWAEPAPRAPAGDPARGLFETLLVVDGRPRRLADHVRRLGNAYWEAYGVRLAADVPAAVAAAVGDRRGYLRVRVDAGPADPARVTVRVAEWAPPVGPADQPGVLLAPATVTVWSGHKLADRDRLDALERDAGPDVVPLLVDPAGFVLETTRSCVAVVRGGRLHTPPLDGRILPGTARQAVLDALDAARLPYDLAPLRLAELADADGMLVCNAIRGVQWVRAVAGTPARWTGPDPLTVALAGAVTADTPLAPRAAPVGSVSMDAGWRG